VSFSASVDPRAHTPIHVVCLFGYHVVISHVQPPRHIAGLIESWHDYSAVQFWYEWFDESGQWWRTYGLEDWTFADNGLMRKRQMSGNDVKIRHEERWFKEGVDVNTVPIEEKHW
jgi:nuclear transport factor 2 (NTF2) superfamily protein